MFARVARNASDLSASSKPGDREVRADKLTIFCPSRVFPVAELRQRKHLRSPNELELEHVNSRLRPRRERKGIRNRRGKQAQR
jgi:hypothetical protein